MTTFSLFISDLHLKQEDPTLVARFINFIRTLAPKAEALYILGDFFEAWVGDDDNTEFNRKISHHLLTLTQKGVPVFFMHGNRDFLIGKKYADQSGFNLLPDPCVITLYNQRILLSHGDLLCTQDTRHQKYRKFVLNPFWQTLLLKLPLCLRRTIAKHLRKKSGHHNRYAQSTIMDVTDSEVIKLMQAHQVKLLVHGHTHKPNIHTHQTSHEQLTRIVLGAWHDHADYLKFYSTGEYELLQLEPVTPSNHPLY